MTTYPFEILKKRLTDKVPALKEVDLYMNQDSMKDRNADLKAMPAIFIDFRPYTISNLGLRLQSAVVDFDCIMLTDTVYDTGSKRLRKTSPIDHMIMFDDVFHALNGFSSRISFLPDFTALEGTVNDIRVMNTISRISINPPQQYRKSLMRSVQRFRCVIYDQSKVINLTKPIPLPGLAIEVQLPYPPTADQDTWTADTTAITADRS